MAHLFDLPLSLQNLLYKQAVPEIRPKVVMSMNAKPLSGYVNGVPQFANVYRYVELDITDRIIKDEPIRLVTTKPEIPSGKGNATKGANVKISVINTDQAFATTQDGAIIDPNSIRNASIKIYIQVENQEYQVYQGRVIGNPEEMRGKTVFNIRDAVSDIVERPVKFEVLGAGQNTYIDGLGNLAVTTEEVGTTYKARFYDAYTYLDYRGLPQAAVKNSSSDIGLKNIDFTSATIYNNALDISLYTIEFVSDTNFIFRGPNIQDYSGSIESTFETQFCRILPTDWDVNGDPTGTTIEVQLYYTVVGNPITIIKRLLEHSFLDSWGKTPTQPTTIPIDWDALDYLETVYEGFTVYVSETNKDPSVYSFESQSRPISAKQIIEYISEHIGCYLTTDNQGRITLTNHFQSGNKVIHDINSNVMISHKILSTSKKYDICVVQYGRDSSKYASEKIFTETFITDYNSSVDYLAGDIVKYNGVFYQAITDNPAGSFVLSNWNVFYAEKYTFPYRYFKTSTSEEVLNNLGKKVIPRILGSGKRLSAELIPQFAAPMIAGDVVRIVSSEHPKITTYAEAVRVSALIGDKSVIQFSIIDQPQKLELWDEGDFDSGDYN